MSSHVSVEDIQSAAERGRRAGVAVTPVLTCAALDAVAGDGRKLFLKCENFQKTGSFKTRGAASAVLAAVDRSRNSAGNDDDRGGRVQHVATHSSGNHGQAIVWACQRAGVACTVVVPEATSKAKRAAVAAYGAQLVLCGNSPQARQETCEK